MVSRTLFVAICLFAIEIHGLNIRQDPAPAPLPSPIPPTDPTDVIAAQAALVDQTSRNGNRTGSFESGVEVKKVEAIQEEMREREKELEAEDDDLRTAVEEINDLSQTSYAKIAQQAELLKEKSKATEAKSKAAALQKGVFTPPIIILKAAPADGLEKIQLEKMLSCSHGN